MKFKASKVEVEPILKGKDGRIYRPDIVVTGHGPDGEDLDETIVIEAKAPGGGPHADRRAREQALTYAEIIRDNRNRVAHGMGPLVDTDWFKDKMAEARVSLRQLAPKMGMEPSSLSMTINGKRKLSADEASRLAGFLDVPVEDVLRAAGMGVKAPSADLVPVVAWLDATGQACGPDGLLGPKAVAGPADAPANLKAVRAQACGPDGLLGPKAVAGPADAPANLKAVRAQAGKLTGWLFYFQDVQGDPRDAVGWLCMVQGVGDTAPRLRFVQRGFEPRQWNLTPLDGEFIESCQLLSASPVVWVKP